MNRILIFCASSQGNDPIYMKTAYEVGVFLAQQGIGIVYGGAKVGMMGAVADGALDNGGEVIGVLPDFLRNKEIAHQGLSELIVVKSMHERKIKMDELSDASITLPGGFGTMDELFEMLTWAQLGLHKKPVALLNANGYYDAIISLLERMTKDGLLKNANKQILLADDNMQALFEKMKAYQANDVPKWITKDRI